LGLNLKARDLTFQSNSHPKGGKFIKHLSQKVHVTSLDGLYRSNASLVDLYIVWQIAAP
jgi:hypothetical protein